MSPNADLMACLLARLRQVRDLLGMAEFLALVAEDFRVRVETIEQAAGRRYGSVGELAAALHSSGMQESQPNRKVGMHSLRPSEARPNAWLAATAVRLPAYRQPASVINALLRRPSGWLEEHAGIEERCLWRDDDPLDAAAGAAQDCLRQADLSPAAVGALLVTSEAPPVLTGLAATLHARLDLPTESAALEIGGACTGFLAALWTAQHLLIHAAAVLVIAVEAPSRWLALSPTPAGEAAALFGDAAAACLLTAQPTRSAALRLHDIVLGTDTTDGSLLRIEMTSARGAELHMDGIALAHRAVRTMADAVRQLCARHGLNVDRLAAVIAHGGNGRMPSLFARRLGLPPQLMSSETARTGNLGSASLPVAWVASGSASYPAIWTAVGAGLQWGAALFDALP